ncbi:MAG TPA: methyltransferase [Acidimicrobiales bacterium]|nr:methyltransferase [Acidimicrobiales bacterium]
MMDVGPDPRTVNLAWWEEAAVLHESSAFYDLAGFRTGRDPMRPFEIEELGDVSGLSLLHLQCHVGTDTLAWARRGARVVGLDFSANALEVAGQLARDCGLDAEFVRSDVYDAPQALGHRRFDVVYTGVGALNWLADLGRWAGAVAELLRPGGVLYVAEIHPLVLGMVEDGRTLAHDILDAPMEVSDDHQGTYAVPEAAMASTVTVERIHAVSEVFTAVRRAGLVVEALHEHAYTNAPWPWTVRSDDGFFRLPDGWPRFPLVYTLLARAPAETGKRSTVARGQPVTRPQ